MTKIALFLQWAAMVFVLALTAQAAPAASPDKPPPHWVPGRGDQGWQWRTDVWLPAKHARVIQCETHTTWTWNSGTYQGAYGFAVSSWDQFKPVAWWPKEAYEASPWQQYQTALAIYRRYGWSGWGCRGA
jgi:hypothetical protein